MKSSAAVLLLLVVCCHGIGIEDVLPRPIYAQGGTPPVNNPNWSTTGSRECSTSDDCRQDRTCSDFRCTDPCLDVCGINAVCRVVRHIAVCSCIDGFVGDPTKICNYKSMQECSYSGDCPLHKACEANRCEDPCADFCGENTACQVKRHIPVCSCLPGYSGDAIQGCTRSGGNAPEGNGIIPDRKPTGKKKFIVEELKTGWFEVRWYCKSRGMKPVVIENQEQNDDFVAAIKKEQPEWSVWIEGSDMGMEGQWYWMTTGQWIKYTNWHEGHPDGGGRDNCLHYEYRNNEYKWSDVACPFKSHVACEYY